MDEAQIIQLITDRFPDVEVLTVAGDSYFFVRPADGSPSDHKFPFATLVTGDRHDTFSNLDRPGVFRLNIGVSKTTFQSLFDAGANKHDFTALDTLMPHPVYAAQHWVCVLNPSDETIHQKLRPLLAEAHATAVKRHGGKRATPQ